MKRRTVLKIKNMIITVVFALVLAFCLVSMAYFAKYPNNTYEDMFEIETASGMPCDLIK